MLQFKPSQQGNALHSQAKASEKQKGIDKQAKACYSSSQQVPKGKAETVKQIQLDKCQAV